MTGFKRFAPAILVLALLMGLAILRLHPAVSATTSEAGNTQGETDRVAVLEAEIGRNRQATDQRLARIEKMLAGLGGNGDFSSAPVLQDDREQQREIATRVQANQLALARTFAGTAAGPLSVEAESRVRRAIASPMLGDLADQPLGSEVRCRQRMCTIRAVFPPGSDAEAWTTRLSLALAPGYGNARTAVSQSPAGDTEITLYAVPPGSERLLNLN